MSIVERALEKIRRPGTPEAVSTPLRGAPVVGRVVDRIRDARHASTASLPVQRRREPIGNPEKSVQVDEGLLRESGLLPPEHQQRELAMQFRSLKRPLLRQAFSPPEASPQATPLAQRGVLVTSALAGEGKTFTAINLALSLSREKDHGVILVDGDVAKPHVSHTFGVDSEPGLLDLIEDPKLSIETTVLSTTVPGLSLLPVGRREGEATELLASARMREVLAQLESLDPQGIVLLDAPPLLLTSEARVLATLFGQVVLVVRADVTPQSAVLEAIRLIGEGPRVGLVLNQATHDDLLGGYYGYGSGAAYGSEPEARTGRAGGG